MIEFKNNVTLIQDPSELPCLPDKITALYLDFETSSGDPKLDSLNPWHHCKPCGYGITWDDLQKAYYVPMSVHGAEAFLKDALNRSDTWVNHHVKYDAHVYRNCIGELPKHLKLRCTVVSSKLIDSDMMFNGGYSLDNLSAKWLGHDISKYEEALQPYLYRNKDYGRIPDDVIGEYGGEDVLTCRELDRYTFKRMPADCYPVWGTEQKLTKVLFNIEQKGLGVNPNQLKIKDLELMYGMLMIEQKLHELLGWPCKPHTNADCHEILHVQYGLPVISWTKGSSSKKPDPSYDKHALAAYLQHPHAPHHVVKLLLEYRTMHTLRNFFVTPYRELEVDGVLHSQYNQLVRTGRLSSYDPNSQQLNKAAKELIVPRAGNALLSQDQSQVEFRIIGHYIKNENIIKAYAENPDTDFHQWVADMVHTKRKPAKTINFMIGYGGGKKKTISNIAANEDIINEIKQELGEEQSVERFTQACVKRGENLYDTYHGTFPELKKTSYLAAAVASNRGWIRNLYHRRRVLSRERAHTAFNTICQSSAADIMKERTVAIAEMLEGTPIFMIANVHDEILYEGPEDAIRDPQTLVDLTAAFETPSVELRVPLRVSSGISNVNWRQAAADDNTRTIDWKNGPVGQLDHLKS